MKIQITEIKCCFTCDKSHIFIKYLYTLILKYTFWMHDALAFKYLGAVIKKKIN